MKLLITGDLVLSEAYNVSEKIDNRLVSLFEESDYNIVNLEAPVTTSTSKINKTGPNIKSHEQSTKAILNLLDVDLVTLANNHVLDFDEQGVVDTLEFCKKNEVSTVGAGVNLKEASKVFYIETGKIKIAVVNIAENEWTSASESSAGSNPVCLEDNYKQIVEAKQQADLVITIIHGGHEHFHYPSPAMQKRYRFLADIGSDAVIAHHTHCIGGIEVYKNTPICYSLGNFLFPMNKTMKDSWYTGFIAELEIHENKGVQVNLLPIRLDENTNVLTLLSGKAKEEVLEHLSTINKVLLDSSALKLEWERFVNRVQPGIIKRITPIGAFRNRYIRGGLYKTGLYKVFLNHLYLKEHLNRIRCEAHHEVTKSILRNLLNNKTR